MTNQLPIDYESDLSLTASLVFIEAQAMNIDSEIRKGLCQVWKRVAANDPVRTENQLQEEKFLKALQCLR